MGNVAKNSEEIPLKERLEAIAVFLPQFVKEEGNEKIDTVLSQLVDVAYRYGWVRETVNWPEWIQTSEATALRNNPSVLAQATEDQLACLITTCIRQERFCEGATKSAYDSGLLTGILQRATALLTTLQVKTETEVD